MYDAGDWAGQKSDGALSKHSFACDCGVCRSNNYHGRKMKQRKSNVIFEAREKDWEVEQGAGQQDGFYDHFDEFDYWGEVLWWDEECGTNWRWEETLSETHQEELLERSTDSNKSWLKELKKIREEL